MLVRLLGLGVMAVCVVAARLDLALGIDIALRQPEMGQAAKALRRRAGAMS